MNWARGSVVILAVTLAGATAGATDRHARATSSRISSMNAADSGANRAGWRSSAALARDRDAGEAGVVGPWIMRVAFGSEYQSSSALLAVDGGHRWRSQC